MYFVHQILGLQDLGYEVHYVERLNKAGECYNPQTSVSSDDPGYAVEYLQNLLPSYGVPGERICFIDRQNNCHGGGWERLRSVLRNADFLLTVADPVWFDELELCARRIFIDADPLFTQVAMETGVGSRASAPRHYDTLFSYCTRFGQPDCTVPNGSRAWIASRPAVSTRIWLPAAPDPSLPLTGLMHWAAGSEVPWNGVSYGHKDREFMELIDLPLNGGGPYVLAVGGRRAPRDLLREKGWQLADPLEQTGTIENYKRFIAGSRADLGIAKHAYVASRCGWFSDRATCFLASGRPVLHQETGFSDWLPAGLGVLSFRNLEELKEAIRSLDLDYDNHAKAARMIAEEHFEATQVVGEMLALAGLK